jgi:trehalose 6-phosphate synthase
VPDRPVVLVSNRGPVTFTRKDGELVAKRGAGGLVSGLAPLVAGTDAMWIAAAMTDGDREAAAGGVVEAEGFRVRTLAVDPDDYRMTYDVVCNGTLWFLYHNLFDLARQPRFDERWREAWAAYRRVNEAFADAVADEAPDGAAVLVQDYHLALVAERLAERRRDVAIVHFSHTPFCTPDLVRVLPGNVGGELLAGMVAARSCGFHTRRWAARFDACCRSVLGTPPRTFVAPLAPDPDDIRSVAASEACDAELAALDERIGGRRLILRVERMELSKNVLRGFHAFDDLLSRHPELRGEVVFGAFVYPSRESLPAYLAYRQEVESLVRRVNERWGTADWEPVLLDMTDNFPRSVAGLRRSDVLLVNAVSDGLNLVTMEGALVNERAGVLALSREAGAWEELGALAIGLNPYDLVETADALHAALTMPVDERRRRADALALKAAERTPADWLGDLLAAAG